MPGDGIARGLGRLVVVQRCMAAPEISLRSGWSGMAAT